VDWVLLAGVRGSGVVSKDIGLQRLRPQATALVRHVIVSSVPQAVETLSKKLK